MKIRISPTALLLCFVLLADNKAEFFATVIAALFHECGHLLAAKYLHIRLKRLEFDIFGAKLLPAGILPSYRAEALLAAGGPMFSILLGLFSLPHAFAFMQSLALTSFSLGLFNLLPIDGFDGGRILSAVLSFLFDAERAKNILSATTYLCLLLLFALASCLLLRFGQSMTLAVLCAYLFVQLFLGENEKTAAYRW